MKVIVAGVAGRLGQMVAERLVEKGHTVVGVDRRPWIGAPSAIEVHTVDLRKRAAEDVFRTHRPDAVIHMATVTLLALARKPSDDQFRVNLGGTRALFEHCHAYGVKQVVFVGRHTYYGAAADAALYHTEDEPPLEVATFPELADLVAADLYAGSALWRYPDMATAVLRMCYTLGPTHHGTLAAYVEPPRVPSVLGFDPLFQFMHEEDVVTAITLALEKRLRGVYNVAGPQPVPLSTIVRTTGRTLVPLPEPIFKRVLGRFGFPALPENAVTHIKYPIVIDATAFRRATGFSPAFDEDQAMRAYRDR